MSESIRKGDPNFVANPARRAFNKKLIGGFLFMAGINGMGASAYLGVKAGRDSVSDAEREAERKAPLPKDRDALEVAKREVGEYENSFSAKDYALGTIPPDINKARLQADYKLIDQETAHNKILTQNLQKGQDYTLLMLGEVLGSTGVVISGEIVYFEASYKASREKQSNQSDLKYA